MNVGTPRSSALLVRGFGVAVRARHRHSTLGKRFPAATSRSVPNGDDIVTDGPRADGSSPRWGVAEDRRLEFYRTTGHGGTSLPHPLSERDTLSRGAAASAGFNPGDDGHLYLVGWSRTASSHIPKHNMPTGTWYLGTRYKVHHSSSPAVPGTHDGKREVILGVPGMVP